MSFKRIFENQIGSVEISIDLESHTGRVKEFEGFFTELEIIEDITNFTLSGSITFTDTTSLKEYLPIIGGEKLRVKFRTSKDFAWYEKEFIITKPGNENVTSGRHKTIQLYFASAEILTNFSDQFSKSYKNKTPSDILSDVFTQQLKSNKPLNAEKTSNSMNFIIPYWNPFQTIQFLMKRSMSAVSKDSGYLFYENGAGFNFESISGIFKKTAVKEILLHQLRNADNQPITAFVGVAKYHTYLKTTDLIEDVKRGVTGSSIYTFDYGTKSFMKREMEWEKFTDKNGVALGKNSIYTDGFVHKSATVSEFTSYVNDRIVEDVDFPNSINDQSKIHLRNKNLFNILNNNAIVVGKSGDSELFCGTLLKVEQLGGESNTVNEKLYGNYLSKCVKHKINLTEGYNQVLLMTKPFYAKDVDNITNQISGKVNK